MPPVRHADDDHARDDTAERRVQLEIETSLDFDRLILSARATAPRSFGPTGRARRQGAVAESARARWSEP